MPTLLGGRRYSPRTYVLAATDSTSTVKVERFEHALGRELAASNVGVSEGELGAWMRHSVTVIPRSREVGQSYVLSVFTTLYALVFGRECPGLASLPLCRARPSFTLLHTTSPPTSTHTHWMKTCDHEKLWGGKGNASKNK